MERCSCATMDARCVRKFRRLLVRTCGRAMDGSSTLNPVGSWKKGNARGIGSWSKRQAADSHQGRQDRYMAPQKQSPEREFNSGPLACPALSIIGSQKSEVKITWGVSPVLGVPSDSLPTKGNAVDPTGFELAPLSWTG